MQKGTSKDLKKEHFKTEKGRKEHVRGQRDCEDPKRKHLKGNSTLTTNFDVNLLEMSEL